MKIFENSQKVMFESLLADANRLDPYVIKIGSNCAMKAQFSRRLNIRDSFRVIKISI
jgi:hypothetical protein